jgi:hypothetical protein
LKSASACFAEAEEAEFQGLSDEKEYWENQALSCLEEAYKWLDFDPVDPDEWVSYRSYLNGLGEGKIETWAM